MSVRRARRTSFGPARRSLIAVLSRMASIAYRMRTKVPRYLYKYRPVDANALAMVASDKLYLSRLDAFNDPFEVPNADLTLETKLCFDPHGKFATLEDPARNEASLPSLRACSLSEDCQDLLMWGHYANR